MNIIRYAPLRHLHKRALVVCEHTKGRITPGTLSVISAARQIPTCESVDAVVIGGEHNTVSGVAAEVATLEGVQRVITLHHERYLHPLAERYAHVLEQLIRDTQSRDAYRWIVAPSSSFGKNLLPRLAAPFDVQPLSDVIAMPAPNQYLRPIYAGNALALVESVDPLHILTIRTTAFPRARPRSDNSTATIESYTPTLTSTTSIDALSTWVGEEVQKSERPELTTARIVVSGGRGLKSGENFKLIYELADVLGAAGEHSTLLLALHIFPFCSHNILIFSSHSVRFICFSIDWFLIVCSGCNAGCSRRGFRSKRYASWTDRQNRSSRTLHCCWYFWSHSTSRRNEGQ